MEIEEYRIKMREKSRLYYTQGHSLRFIAHKFGVEPSLIKEICKDIIVEKNKKRCREINYL